MKKYQSIVYSSLFVIPMIMSAVGCGKLDEFDPPSAGDQRSRLSKVISEVNSVMVASIGASIENLEEHTDDQLALKMQKIIYDKRDLCSPSIKTLDIGFSYVTVMGKIDDDLEKGEEGCPVLYIENAKVVKQSETIKKTISFSAKSNEIKKLSSIRYFSSEVTFPKDFGTRQGLVLDISGSISLGDKSKPTEKLTESIDVKGSLNITRTGKGDSATSQLDGTLDFKFILNSPIYTTQVKFSKKAEDKKPRVQVADQDLSDADAEKYREFLSRTVSPK